MKKIVVFLMLFVVLFSLVMPFAAFAEGEDTYTDDEESEISEIPPVVDFAELLSEEEYIEVSDALYAIREKYNVDVAVYTDSEMYNDNAQDEADDIYDYDGYGMGENDDGILFYVCTNPRAYAFSTYSYAIRVFNDDALEYIDDECISYLKNDDYYSAFMTYAALADKLLENAQEGNFYHSEKRNEEDKDWIWIAAIASLILAFVIAGIATKNKESQMITAVKQDSAADYMKDGSLELDYSKDIFMYSNVTRTKKQTSSGSGGSSTHTSSSGRSHGGRSGSF